MGVDAETQNRIFLECLTIYHSLRGNAQQIIEIVGLEVPDALTLNPERQAYFARILDGLFDLAIRERSLATTPIATPA